MNRAVAARLSNRPIYETLQMPPTSQDIKQLHQALLSAFPDDSSLRRMVRFGLNVNLQRISIRANLDDVMFDLIEWAEAQGRLEELIDRAVEAVPGNPDLKAAAAEFAKTGGGHRSARRPDYASSGYAVVGGVGAGGRADGGAMLVRYLLDTLPLGIHARMTRCGILPWPPASREAHRYLLDLRSRLRNQMREKTYLPLAARPVPRTSASSHQEAPDPFVSPVHQLILHIIGRARGGDSASASIAAVNRRSRVVTNILKLLDRTPHPLMLLGEPGCGKTMTLQQAALMLAIQEECRVFPRVPLYVRLGEFRVQDRAPQASDVYEYVRENAPPLILPYLDALSDEGRLVIFFDGMDEMSRERYSEHTEALSLFADWSDNKTLFSCRITDFNPRFIHERLVLLPFNRSQTYEYLGRYVDQFPLQVDGRSWSRAELSRHLANGDLPIEADNPFVLWLLCLYIQSKHAWPRSRVELLAFYNEENYKRKEEEAVAEGEAGFPERSAMLLRWAGFAFQLSSRGLGPAIPVRMLLDAARAAMSAGSDQHNRFDADQEVLEAIRVGKRCGVLAESRDRHEEHLVRFEHHRFQEFFTARFIHERQPAVDWLPKLDSPRWQETLTNLILMDDTSDVLSVFADAIVRQTDEGREELVRVQQLRKEGAQKPEAKPGSPPDTIQPEVEAEVGGDKEAETALDGSAPMDFVTPDSEIEIVDISDAEVPQAAGDAPEQDAVSTSIRTSGKTAAKAEPAELELPDELETVLADRVELAARIMHQTGAGHPPVRDALMKPFRDAVDLLATHGSPITQVKMMRACQKAPEVDYIEALEHPLNSKVDWVRDQALILIAGSDSGARFMASDVATQMGYDLANGTLPTRLRAYWKGITTSGDSRRLWLLIAAALAYGVSTISLLAAAAALYIGVLSVGARGRFLALPDFGVLGRPPVAIATAVIVGAVWAATLLMRQLSLLWMAVLGSVLAATALIPVLFDVWGGSWSTVGTLVLALIGFAWLAALGVGGLLYAPAHFGTLLVYLVLTRHARRARHSLRAFFTAAWRNCGFDFSLTWGLLAIAGHLALWVGGYWLKIWMKSKDPPLLVAAHTLLAASGVAAVVMVVLEWCSGTRSYLSSLGRAGVMRLLSLTVALAAADVMIFTWFNRAASGDAHSSSRMWPLTLGVPLLLDLAVVAIWKKAWMRIRVPSNWRSSLGTGAIISVIAAIGFVLVMAVWLLTERLWSMLGPLLSHLAVIATGAALVVLIGAAMRPLIYMRWTSRKLRPGEMTPDEWAGRMKAVDPEQQSHLLYRTDYQSLDLTAPQFLELLRSLRSAIKAEPALSAYWEQRHQLEEVLRQEREG